jgi:electron transfer flavoprotein alpha subunit
MSRRMYAYILHQKGTVDDTALELISAAKMIDPDAVITAVVFGVGADLDAVCQKAAQYYQEVWKIDHEKLFYPDAEVIRPLLVRIIPKETIVLIPHEHFGMDLAPGLSILLGASFLSDVVEFQGVNDNQIKAVRQEYNGLVSAHVGCDLAHGAVLTIRPGSFKGEEGQDGNGRVIDKTSEALEGEMPQTKRRFLEFIKTEAGEVDISQSEILVSVGRGIQDQDNIEIVFDLAKAVGGDVSCSRPIVDAKWLDKNRQVGNSGKTVKPKVYMALGISGAFQHLAGIKGNPFIVAVNKNAKAPFFQVADIAIVADILDFVPRLTKKINEMREKQ